MKFSCANDEDMVQDSTVNNMDAAIMGDTIEVMAGFISSFLQFPKPLTHCFPQNFNKNTGFS